MEKMICIPEWQYDLMLKTFDDAMKELKELKEELEKVSVITATSKKKKGFFGDLEALILQSLKIQM